MANPQQRLLGQFLVELLFSFQLSRVDYLGAETHEAVSDNGPSMTERYGLDAK
jgi:hypothetical protein